MFDSRAEFFIKVVPYAMAITGMDAYEAQRVAERIWELDQRYAQTHSLEWLTNEIYIARGGVNDRPANPSNMPRAERTK